MSALTLDRALADAGRLPAEEQELLEDLLRKRRSEFWRAETAGQARKDIAAFRPGKLKAESVDTVIARLRAHQCAMDELAQTPAFEGAFHRLIGKRPQWESKVENALRRMAADINNPRSKTHRLSGRLEGLQASSAETARTR